MMASLWCRYVFASDGFFYSNNSRAEAQGSVGMEELSAAEPVSTSVRTRLLSLVSNFFLFDAADAACAIIEFDTSWPSRVFIWSITLGGPVRSSTWMGLEGKGIVRISVL